MESDCPRKIPAKLIYISRSVVRQTVNTRSVQNVVVVTANLLWQGHPFVVRNARNKKRSHQSLPN